MDHQVDYVHVSVNGITFKVDPDYGSDVNLWPKNYFQQYVEKLGCKPKLLPADRPIKAANKSPIKILGYFPATLSSQHASVVSRIYVMEQELQDLPLLSKYDLHTLGYVRIHPDGAFASKSVNVDMSDEEFKTAIASLHKRFQKVFVGVGTYKHHTVDLHVKENADGFIIRAIPCPIHFRAQALERLHNFVKEKIMIPVPNGYPIRFCSPLLVLPKPNKNEIRLVVNYKKLNDLLCRTRHVPAVGLQDFCRVTRGFTHWFRLDLRHAFHQLKLSKKSQDLTIISTFNGCYKWLKMPQGLINAGDYFDQIMESVLSDCTNTISMRDDIIGGGKSRKEMIEEYTKVLTALESAGLTCDPDPSKCQVGLTEVTFFGMKFSKDGMKPDEKKVAIIKNAKTPINQAILNSFVCMVAWNDTYIHRYAEIVRPLRDLANSKATFEWTDECDKAFLEVKKSLSEHCLNNYFREDRETYLFTDAGKRAHDSQNQYGGFAAILAQKDEKGNFLTIHYCSRSISSTEKSWGQVELEARALRYGIDKFRFYLEGIDIVYCMVDCKALLPLWNNNNRVCPPRIERQRLATQDIRMKLIHLEGSKNPSDWLSRARTEENDASAEDLEDMDVSDELDDYLVKSVNCWESSEPNKPIAIAKIRELTKKDPVLQLVKERIYRNDWLKHKSDKRLNPYKGIKDELSVIDDIIFRGSHQIVMPEELHSTAVALVHSLAHSGMTNTEQLLTNRIWFPGYSTAVRAEVDLCQICKHTVINNRQEPMGYISAPGNPFEIISCDFKGPFHDAYYALVFLDLYSKWPEIYFVTSTSFAAVKKHFDHFWSNFGYCKELKSDSGPPFNGAPFKEYLQQRGIKHTPTIVETPWANEVENLMRSLRKAYDIARLKGWDYKTFMRRMLMIKRATPNPATKVSPHFAATGRILDPGILDGNLPLDPRSGLSHAEQKAIQANLIQSKLDNKRRHDSKKNTQHLDLRPGDMVLVRLGNNKKPEKDQYKVIKLYGTAVTAVNINSGRVLRRHLSRFTRILERPHNPEPPQDHKAEDAGDNDHDQPRHQMPLPNGAQPPQPPPGPPQQQNQQPALNDGNRVPNDLPEDRRQPQQPQQPRQQRQPNQGVHFDQQTHTLEFDAADTIAPRRLTRQQTAATGVPVPVLPNPTSALEHSVRNRNTAQQILNQHRRDTQQALRLDRPAVAPDDPPQNQQQ